MQERKVRAVFTGRVQGVFFRESCKKKALSLGLRGYVRNLEDGSVEALIAGEKDRIDSLLEYCRKSMPAARVDSVDVREAPADEAENAVGFSVRW